MFVAVKNAPKWSDGYSQIVLQRTKRDSGNMGVGLDLQQLVRSPDPTRSDSDQHMWVDQRYFQFVPICLTMRSYPAQICFFWMGQYDFSACLSLVCLKLGTNRMSIDFLSRKKRT